MATAVVYSVGAGDAWRVRKSIASLRRAGVKEDIVLLTLGGGIAEDYAADGCTAVVPVDGILGELGFSDAGWNRDMPYSSLACLAMPLVPQLARYDRALSVWSGVLALNPRFSEWTHCQTRGFEAVGAACSARAQALWAEYRKEADRCFRGDSADEMRRRAWRGVSPAGRTYSNPGVYLWDLELIRADREWYKTRLRSFWAAETKGYATGLADTFVNVFLDSSASATTALNVTKDDVQWTALAAAFNYEEQAYSDVPGCEFNKAAASMGVDKAAGTDVPATLEKCRAGRLAVVHITDGNPDDCQRMVWSMRSIARYSRLEFDSFVLTPPGVRLPDIAAEASQVLRHGVFRQVDDIDRILSGLSITDSGWNRAWPFVVLYRLGIPLHEAFAGYDRVLYMDTDVLVLSDRVDRFLSADISGHEIGGVVDTVQEEHGRIRRNVDEDLRPDFSLKISERYGDTLRLKPYVNAGVLLWNMPEIRKDLPWYRERLRMFWEAECRGRFGFLDQDFVNSMMTVDTGFSMVYNWFTKSGVEADDGECVIRHYCARNYEKMAQRAEAIGLLTKEEIVKRHGKL